jgi:hypothetical protein
LVATGYVEAAAQEPAAAVRALDDDGNTYIALRAGPTIPKHEDLEGFDNGLSVEAALGLLLSENFSVEVGAGRQSLSGTESGYLFDTYGNAYAATATVDLVAWNLSGTVKLIVPVDKVRFFAMGGVGYYSMTSDSTLKVAGLEPLKESDTGGSAALILGGGADVRVSPKARIGAEAKYVMGEVKMSNSDEKDGYDSLIISGVLILSL